MYRELRIGDLCARVPVIQGGMGVGVSLSNLASAVARAGGIGIISTAQIGFRDPDFAKNPIECNLRAVAKEIKKAKEMDLDAPIIVGGGVYTREDMEHYLNMGADGVQMGTRFVTTKECDASDAYKQAHIDAKKEDIVIVKSPVGMPGRAIYNAFLEKVKAGERFMRGCRQCIKSCNPATAPYCITEALINAVEGRLDEGLIFCGSNAYRAQKIESVADRMEEFSL